LEDILPGSLLSDVPKVENSIAKRFLKERVDVLKREQEEVIELGRLYDIKFKSCEQNPWSTETQKPFDIS